MACCQQPTPEYFDSIIKGELEKVKSTTQHAKYDQRPTNLEQNVFKGFAGIHYAIYLEKQDIFEHLFESEWALQTQAETQIYVKKGSMFENKVKFVIGRGTNILLLAAIVGNEEALKFIVNKISGDKKYEVLLKQQNEYQYSVYAALCVSEVPYAIELLEKYKKYFSVVTSGDFAPVMACAFFCKTKQFQTLANIAESDAQFKNEFVKQLQSRNYKSVQFIDYANELLENNSYNIQKEQRQEFLDCATKVYEQFIGQAPKQQPKKEEQPQQQPQEQPKEEPKEQPKEEPKEQVKEEPKEEVKEEPKVEEKQEQAEPVTVEVPKEE